VIYQAAGRTSLTAQQKAWQVFNSDELVEELLKEKDQLRLFGCRYPEHPVP
jgi:hypothetical protein